MEFVLAFFLKAYLEFIDFNDPVRRKYLKTEDNINEKAELSQAGSLRSSVANSAGSAMTHKKLEKTQKKSGSQMTQSSDSHMSSSSSSSHQLINITEGHSGGHFNQPHDAQMMTSADNTGSGRAKLSEQPSQAICMRNVFRKNLEKK